MTREEWQNKILLCASKIQQAIAHSVVNEFAHEDIREIVEYNLIAYELDYDSVREAFNNAKEKGAR